MLYPCKPPTEQMHVYMWVPQGGTNIIVSGSHNSWISSISSPILFFLHGYLYALRCNFHTIRCPNIKCSGWCFWQLYMPLRKHPWNDYASQATEYFHHSRKTLWAPFQLIGLTFIPLLPPLPAQSQPLSEFAMKFLVIKETDLYGISSFVFGFCCSTEHFYVMRVLVTLHFLLHISFYDLYSNLSIHFFISGHLGCS